MGMEGASSLSMGKDDQSESEGRRVGVYTPTCTHTCNEQSHRRQRGKQTTAPWPGSRGVLHRSLVEGTPLWVGVRWIDEDASGRAAVRSSGMMVVLAIALPVSDLESESSV